MPAENNIILIHSTYCIPAAVVHESAYVPMYICADTRDIINAISATVICRRQSALALYIYTPL